MDVGRNRGVCREWFNAVGRFGGGAVFVFEVFGIVRVAFVGFKVYGSLKFG